MRSIDELQRRSDPSSAFALTAREFVTGRRCSGLGGGPGGADLGACGGLEGVGSLGTQPEPTRRLLASAGAQGMSSTTAPSRRATQRWIALRGVVIAVLLWLPLGGVAQGRPELLDAEERDWLRAHGPLRYAPHLDAPPFEQIRADDVAAGIVPELLDLVARNLGTTIRTVRFASWTECLEGVRRGDADLLGLVRPTPERLEFLAFTRPYLDVQNVLFVNRAAIPARGLAGLGGRRVGVVRSYAEYDWLRTGYPEVIAVPVTTTREGLMMLALGQIEGMVDTLQVGQYLIAENALTQLRALPEVLNTTPNHLAVARGHARLLGILQKGLDSLTEPERRAVLARWSGQGDAQSGWRVPPWATRAALAFLALLGLFIAWTLTLRRRVAQQTRTIRAQVEQEAALERRCAELIENATDLVFTLDPAGHFTSVNPATARLLGRTPGELLGRELASVVAPGMAERVRHQMAAQLEGDVSDTLEFEVTSGSGDRAVLEVNTRPLRAEGRRVGLQGIGRDITTRKHMEAEVRRHDAVLEAARFAAEEWLTGAPWEQTMTAVLARLGEVTGVSRAYVFENHAGPGGELLTSQRFEWVAPGVTPQLANPQLQGCPLEAGGFGRWVETMRRRQSVHGPLREFPRPEQEALALQDIRSLAVVPVFVGSRWWGFLGFDDCREERGWSRMELHALQVIANVLGSTLEGQQTRAALATTSSRLEALVASLPSGILFETADRRIQFVNPAFGALFGVGDPGRVVGVDCREAVRATQGLFVDPAGFKARIEQRVSDGVPVPAEELLLADGRVLERDYVPVRAGTVCLGHLWHYRDITGRKHAEAALLAERQRFQDLFEHSPVATWLEDFTGIAQWLAELRSQGVTDLTAFLREHPDLVTRALGLVRVVDVNPAAVVQNAAESKEHLLANLYRLFDQRTYQGLLLELEALWQGRNGFEYESEGRRLDGRPLVVIVRLDVPLQNGQPDFSRVIITGTDITERKQAEETRVLLESRLRHSQKMEAVGQLAGGVAHDFNNLITVVLGNTELLATEPGLPLAARELARQIAATAGRAATLTRQLLTFSRRQPVQLRPLQLNEVLGRLSDLLLRLLGEHITLRSQFAPYLDPVRADVGMLEQVVMNLAVNARDAMPGGGTLTLGTRTETVAPADAQRHPDARAGRFIVLSVADTGCGMDPATVARAFEPFFTTKGVGEGTGLGLATVYGIVKQHEGWVELASQVGQGTTVSVYLPPAAAAASAAEPPPKPGPEAGRGTETILLAEDEPAVRALAARCLRRGGYQVLAAASGLAALKMWETHGSTVDLLVTDAVMPEGVGGVELARRLRVTRPGLRVILMSGYSTELLRHGVEFTPDTAFLQKPFVPAELLLAVRGMLDRQAPEAGAGHLPSSAAAPSSGPAQPARGEEGAS
jgi:PAS domain S-box-containing protein